MQRRFKVYKTAGLGLFEFSNVKIMTNYKSFILTPNPLDWATMHWLHISKDFFLETVSWLDENETLHQNFFKLCVYFIARVTDSGLIWFTLVITLFELLGLASHKLENFSYFFIILFLKTKGFLLPWWTPRHCVKFSS